MEHAVDDGRIRTGTVWSATAHVITALVGSGILTLPWSFAQLGWILGPLILILFAVITYYTAVLLCNCYRSPDPISGRRNYTYMEAIRACLGDKEVFLCGIIQYAILWGTMVGYTITAAMSMMVIKQSHCFHERGQNAPCKVSGLFYAVIYGSMEVVLSQFPNLEKIAALSYTAAATSFAYSVIGLYLCTLEFFSHPKFRGSLYGVKVASRSISPTTKIWHFFQALGNIAFAYSYAMLLIEIQDTLKSPPAENKTMNKASIYGIGGTTIFYISLSCVGYVAFGDATPGNILTGFKKPFWLIDIAHLALLIHLVAAYQVFAQPIFAFYEQRLATKWPNSDFFNRTYAVKIPFCKTKTIKFTLAKIFLRTIFVAFTTATAMIFPFFNAIVGLLGSMVFWPLTVYYPVAMYKSQAKIKRGQKKWIILQLISMISLLVSVLAVVGSVADIILHIKHAGLLKFEL
uniref:Amino acid transporter transmembrane domain-containing protein n=1 Tax=Ananas comosus var. bracteatus TaxID=296719 RepID=A0A6V7NHV5_ANACO|nr:unnamed protein product [Ananas comosus var. bracteatus]